MLEWVAMPSSRGSSRPRDWTRVCISCIGRWILYRWATGEDPPTLYKGQFKKIVQVVKLAPSLTATSLSLSVSPFRPWVARNTQYEGQGALQFFPFVCVPISLSLSSWFKGLLFLTTLLRYNSHVIKFTHSKCTIQWVFSISRVVQPSPRSILEIFINPQKEAHAH